MPEGAPFELFHRLGDAASGAVRRRVAERGLLPPASFRNVHFDSHRARLEALGGHDVPAIWDGAHLHVGEAACLAFLDRRTDGAPDAG